MMGGAICCYRLMLCVWCGAILYEAACGGGTVVTERTGTQCGTLQHEWCLQGGLMVLIFFSGAP